MSLSSASRKISFEQGNDITKHRGAKMQLVVAFLKSSKKDMKSSRKKL